MEIYVKQITNPIIRKGYTKFRLSNHSLNIEKGRHSNKPKELRFCPFCPTLVETEIHFLLECNTYKLLREELIQPFINTNPSFAYHTQTKKFKFLLSGNFSLIIAKFIFNCQRNQKGTTKATQLW